MLGVKTKRTPIGGDVANQIRNAVARVANGKLNAQEQASVERSKRIRSQYKVRWIGLDGKEL